MLPQSQKRVQLMLEVFLWTAFGLACLTVLAGCGSGPSSPVPVIY